jgi:hypothetical protein
MQGSYYLNAALSSFDTLSEFRGGRIIIYNLIQLIINTLLIITNDNFIVKVCLL